MDWSSILLSKKRTELLKMVFSIFFIAITIVSFPATAQPGGGSSNAPNPFLTIKTINEGIDNAEFQESIDGSTGALSISQTDMFLPGNGGLDVSIKRHYSMAPYYFSAIRYGHHSGSMGTGWNLTFGHITTPEWHTNSMGGISVDNSKPQIEACSFDGGAVNVLDSVHETDNPSLFTSDGGRYVMLNADLIVDPSAEEYSFITENGWRGGCGSAGFVMYSPDGHKYYFDTLKRSQDGSKLGANFYIEYWGWYVSKIEDQYGNYIDISYRGESRALIDSISTSDGRLVDFQYTSIDSYLYLSSIVSNGESIDYQYDAEGRLESVSLGQRSLWTYSYSPYYPDNANAISLGADLLASVETEAGGIIEYDYLTFPPLWANYGQPAVQYRSTSGSLPSSQREYSYEYMVIDMTDFNSNSFPYNVFSNVRDPGWFNEVLSEYPLLRSKVKEADRCTVGIYGVNLHSPSHAGLLYAENTYSDNDCASGLVQTYHQEWLLEEISDEDVYTETAPTALGALDDYYYGKRIAAEQITRDDVIYRKEYSNFTIFGKPETVVESTENSLGSILAEREVRYTYTSSGFEFGVELPLTEKIYSSVGSLISSLTNTYSSDYELVEVDDDGIDTEYGYDSQGNLSYARDALNNQTNYSNYYRGVARTISDAIGTRYKIVDHFGNVTGETDELGNQLGYQFEDIDRLKKITPAVGAAINYSYTSNTVISTQSDLKITQTLDGYKRPTLIKVQDTGANITQYQNISYDEYDHEVFRSIQSDSSAEAVGTYTEHDVLGRVSRLATPISDLAYEYQDDARIKFTNARGFDYYYDTLGYGQPDYDNVTRIEHPSSSGTIVTEIEKDPVGRILSVTQGDGNYNDQEITYQYHNTYRNLVTEVVYPQFTHKFGYDAAANQTSRSVNNGSITYQDYDSRNRLEEINYPFGMDDVTLTYFNNNLLKTAENGLGDWTFQYDGNGSMTSRSLSTNGQTFSFGYSYDAQNYIEQMTYPGVTVDYAPDALGRSTKAGSYASSVTYHPTSSIKSFTYGNGLTYDLGMHANKVMIGSILGEDGSNSVISKNYDYDGNGNATNITDNLNANYSVTGFSYDGVDRLLSARSGAWDGTVNLSYDRLGNITEKDRPDRLLTYEYDSDNQLTSIETTAKDSGGFIFVDVGGVLAPIPFGVQSGTDEYSYDYRGNVTDNARHNIVYNEADQLISASSGSSGQTYRYDALGRRVQVVDSSGTVTAYEVYDDDDRMLFSQDQSGNRTRKVYLGNHLIAVDDEGDKEYIHFDTLGSTIGVSDANGDLQTQHYFPFGEKVSSPSTNNDQWYTGKKFDEYLDLSYHGARYYDPSISRFYSNDPVGYTNANPVMSFNRYLYTNNNPYKYTDPDGEFLNFAVKFAADVALGAALNYLETGEVNLGGAILDAAVGVVNPAKTVQKVKRLNRALKGDGCSFSAETLVLTKSGYVPISSIEIGDFVLAKNDETNETSWRKVLNIFQDWHEEIITLSVVDEEGTQEDIVTTAEHPFYVKNLGWLTAGNLSLAHTISGPTKGDEIKITGIQKRAEPQHAYNLTVDTDHTYFVGKTDMWVHNACTYRVPGERTQSGKPYIGQTGKDSPDQRPGNGRDGRDRHAEDTTTEMGDGDTTLDRKIQEQKEINSGGGVSNLDNRINSIKQSDWEKYDIPPPEDGY